ncbi:MAG: NAD(P)H-dependent oxidoreductase [Desulforhabdus sp.]|jgi:putative NADPH-quinone reductase|nr:NAD(P)H-dependent oxidoreductase [Desulforhabdus sp.]
MKVSVIVAHPSKFSFNHALAESAVDALSVNQYTIYYHDLYEERFNPILEADEIPKDAVLPKEIEVLCEEITHSDGIVIIHPNWWGQPPAILKGWVDRIIRPGVAYEFLEGDSGEGIPNGLLKGKTALVFNTSNTPSEREKKVFGDPLEVLWKNCIFDLCGVSRFHRRMFGVIVTSSEDQRKAWLREVRETVSRFFPSVNDASK